MYRRLDSNGIVSIRRAVAACVGVDDRPFARRPATPPRSDHRRSPTRPRARRSPASLHSAPRDQALPQGRRADRPAHLRARSRRTARTRCRRRLKLSPPGDDRLHGHLVLGQRPGLVGADRRWCCRASRPRAGAGRRAFRRAMRLTPIASVIVSAAGSPSGIAPDRERHGGDEQVPGGSPRVRARSRRSAAASARITHGQQLAEVRDLPGQRRGDLARPRRPAGGSAPISVSAAGGDDDPEALAARDQRRRRTPCSPGRRRRVLRRQHRLGLRRPAATRRSARTRRSRRSRDLEPAAGRPPPYPRGSSSDQIPGHELRGADAPRVRPSRITVRLACETICDQRLQGLLGPRLLDEPDRGVDQHDGERSRSRPRACRSERDRPRGERGCRSADGGTAARSAASGPLAAPARAAHLARPAPAAAAASACHRVRARDRTRAAGQPRGPPRGGAPERWADAGGWIRSRSSATLHHEQRVTDLRRGQGRTTSTEDAARCATRSLTLPSARTPLAPREPTTSRSALEAASTRASTGRCRSNPDLVRRGAVDQFVKLDAHVERRDDHGEAARGVLADPRGDRQRVHAGIGAVEADHDLRWEGGRVEWRAGQEHGCRSVVEQHRGDAAERRPDEASPSVGSDRDQRGPRSRRLVPQFVVPPPADQTRLGADDIAHLPLRPRERVACHDSHGLVQLGEITLGRLEDVPHDQLRAPAAGDGVEKVGGRDQHQASVRTGDSRRLSRRLECLPCAVDAAHDALKRGVGHVAALSRGTFAPSIGK